MDIQATKTAATVLLDNYYQIYTSDLPTQRTKSQWQAENKRGFFLGIIQEGEDSHIIRLLHLLATHQFTQQQEFSTTSQLADPQHPRTFIDDMFARYILPFHKDYSDSSSCHTPLSSNPPSISNSVEDLDDVPEERELTHKDLKKAVEKRDGVCLFCWGGKQCHGAHIIAQKNIPMVYDEPSLLARAGLTQKHQVQNGLLLCANCHGEFEQLQRYVDVVDDKLVVKVVNHSVLGNDDKHRDWEIAFGKLKNDRLFMERYWSDGRQGVEPNGETALHFVVNDPTKLPNRQALEFHKAACQIKEWQRDVRNLRGMRRLNEEDWTDIDNRQAAEANGEMALYFVVNDPTKLPNRQALEFHKTACQIWRMAGGAESEDEHCPDDDDYVPVDYRSKSIEKWMDSSATLVIESTP